MSPSFDFIIVGAGTSGSLLASRLARSHARPSVLLLEAGGRNEDAAHLSGAERFNVAFDPASELNWHYKTEPQNQLAGNVIDYSRGRGLGGSTAINFCGWLTGPRDDYDEWARVVGDNSYRWHNVQKCYRRLLTVHPEIPHPGMQQYLRPRIAEHGGSGPIQLAYGTSSDWFPRVPELYTAAMECGLPINPDINDGDPIGFGMGSVSIYQGFRGTSASIFLASPPPNLTVISDALVEKVLLQHKRAVGVMAGGTMYLASKEVILSGGAINTPQVLMLSGVGPADELHKHKIPVLHELPQIGQNLQDHCVSSVGIVIRDSPDHARDPTQQSPTPMAFLKSAAVAASPQYQALPAKTRAFLEKSTVPHFELACYTPASFLGKDGDFGDGLTFIGTICLVDMPQSRGTISLRSANPFDKPIIDPKFLTHPYDRRVIIEAIRQQMALLSAPTYKVRTVQVLGPKDDSDEAIWEHVRHHVASSWHMSCTVKMGTDPRTACVDSNFRIFGLQALRVIDMSVTPFVPNSHTQSTAYLIGELGAMKLIKQYGLDRTVVSAAL